MNYQEAKEIRGKRLRDLLADNLISGGSVKESVKKTLSQRTQAKIKGMKETFDPLNIAKFITGGSKLGPALLGRLMGRSQEDINYFTGSPNKVVNNLEEHNPLLKVLDKMYTFMNKNYLDDIKRRELEKNFLEEKQIEDEKRHNILIETLKKLMARIGRLQAPVKQEETSKSGGGLLGGLQDLVTKRAARIAAAQAAASATKITAAQAAASATKIVANRIAGFTLSSALKKIPIAGLIIGSIFGVKKLVDGDIVGAGMEVASGAAGTVPYAGTAASLGIDVAGLAREVYKEVFGKFPEEEPEVAEQRMTMIANIIEDQIKSKISSDKKPESQVNKTNNQVTPTNTPDIKPANAPTSLNAAEGASKNTTTPLSPSTSGSPPMGANLQDAQGTNLNLNVQNMGPTTEPSPPSIINVPGDGERDFLKTSNIIPSVRTNESTFRNSIYNSTVVV